MQPFDPILRQLHISFKYIEMFLRARGTSMCWSNIIVGDACDRLVMMIATSHVQFKCWRRSVFLRWEPFGWVVPSCFIGRRTTSKNLISSKSKFQEFEHIHHKFCLSCGFCAWVSSAYILVKPNTRILILFLTNFVPHVQFHSSDLFVGLN